MKNKYFKFAGIFCLVLMMLFSFRTSFADCDVNSPEKIKINYVSSGKSNVLFENEKITKVIHGSKIIFDINSFYGKCVGKIKDLKDIDIKVDVDGNEFNGYVDKRENGEFELYIPFGVKGKLNMTVIFNKNVAVKDVISFEVVQHTLYGEASEVSPFYIFKNKVDFSKEFATIDYTWDLTIRKYVIKLPKNPFGNDDKFTCWAVEYEDSKDQLVQVGEILKLDAPNGYIAIKAIWSGLQEWINEDGNWYYVNENGKIVKSEWIYDENYKSWFYFKEDGKCAQNEWQGSYYLKNGGYMASLEWIYDENYKSWYYLKSDGSYARNEWEGNYYLKEWGNMAKSEWIYDENYKSWYYLKSDGNYARNEWIAGYYLGNSGAWEK